MADREQLSTQNSVYRVGKTTTRPAGEWSGSIHRLLRFFEEKGLRVPHPIGIADGIETLEVCLPLSMDRRGPFRRGADDRAAPPGGGGFPGFAG